jgi:hypothetical protein
VPLWLPGLYMLAAPVMGEVDDLALSPSATSESAAR